MAPASVNVTLLQALQRKYQVLHALRLQAAPSAVPRAQLAALAEAFPGALRELDRLPLFVIERRLAALATVLGGAARIEAWMSLQIAYHGFMRAALRIRRALRTASDHSGDAQARLARIEYVPAGDEPARTRFDAHALATLLKPPHGRLNPWVMEQVALDHGVTSEAVDQALFSIEAS